MGISDHLMEIKCSESSIFKLLSSSFAQCSQSQKSRRFKRKPPIRREAALKKRQSKWKTLFFLEVSDYKKGHTSAWFFQCLLPERARFNNGKKSFSHGKLLFSSEIYANLVSKSCLQPFGTPGSHAREKRGTVSTAKPELVILILAEVQNSSSGSRLW